MSKRKPSPYQAFAWQINFAGRWETCFWAEPSRAKLVAAGRPAPDARIVRVKLVAKRKRARSRK